MCIFSNAFVFAWNSPLAEVEYHQIRRKSCTQPHHFSTGRRPYLLKLYKEGMEVNDNKQMEPFSILDNELKEDVRVLRDKMDQSWLIEIIERIHVKGAEAVHQQWVKPSISNCNLSINPLDIAHIQLKSGKFCCEVPCQDHMAARYLGFHFLYSFY